ncbi:bestrophin-like domain [Actinokineospora bangkokensis]|uniref:DUF4239 domain-containing protein n=1 Tax=Actinokineospora bangkokensis TaxID=1193682 RepID=A0A1Q9LBM6_9PSEU|nr:DUF4239 domain-containing protein [Actinokineospora bangkokensis]OLR89426.1 hypothetical protein BJP25_04880 [Actinokineospora bangkokensis]
MDTYLQGLLWVVGAAVVTAAVAYLIRRVGETQGVVDNNEAAGQVFTIVGGLHAVLLAFVLISLFDGTTAAEDGSYREADGLVAATWAVDALPEPARTELRDLAARYAQLVADEEWPQMSTGDGEVTGDGWALLDRMRAVVQGAQAGEDFQVDQKGKALDELWDVYEARTERLNAAGGDGVTDVVWFALVLGSVMTVALALLFGGPQPLTHIVIVSVLAGILSLLLFATYQLQNPYAGGAKVDPTAFESVLARLR